MITIFKRKSKTLGLKLLGSIGIAELLIMLFFRFVDIGSHLSPLQVDFADAVLLSVVASVMIFYWVVKPMKTFEARKQAEELLREQKRFAENLIDKIAIATYVLDRNHKILLWNKAAEELCGITAAAMLGTENQRLLFHPQKQPTVADLVLDDDHEKLAALYPATRKSTLAPDAVHAEGWFRKINGRDRYLLLDAAPLFDPAGKPAAVIETLQDITERKQAEEQAHFLAYYDKLTKLPNRAFFKELLSRTMETGKRYGQTFAIFAIALENFRRINDTLGYDVGDRLLQEVATRLVDSFRQSDYLSRTVDSDETTVAHLGTDEFMILLHETGTAEVAGRIAERILEKFSAPFAVAGHEVHVSASIGTPCFRKMAKTSKPISRMSAPPCSMP